MCFRFDIFVPLSGPDGSRATAERHSFFVLKGMDAEHFVGGFTSIWVNYNDLTATSLESWLVRGIIPNGLNSG